MRAPLLSALRLAAVATAVAGAFALLAPAAQAQDAGTWMVRARALNLNSANGDSTGLKLTINDKTFPEVDISYFLSKNLAAELILTYPQKQKVYAGGVEIGSFKHLPPTLTLQYHFTDMGAFKPYVGAGLNLTFLSKVNFIAPIQTALGPSLESSSTGLAAQVGFDYAIDKNMVFNVDIKKVQIRTDVKSFGAKVGTFKVDPLLVGVGLGWKF